MEKGGRHLFGHPTSSDAAFLDKHPRAQRGRAEAQYEGLAFSFPFLWRWSLGMMTVEAVELAGWLLFREAEPWAVSAMVSHPVFEECG